MDLRKLRYGIEIKTVKRTREQIAWAIHSVVSSHIRHIGAPSCYDPWEVDDLRDHKWKVVNDAIEIEAWAKDNADTLLAA